MKVFEDASGWAIAEYNLGLVERWIARAIFNHTEIKAGDKTTIYGIGRFETSPMYGQT